MEEKRNNQVSGSTSADLLPLSVEQSPNLPAIVLASGSPRRAEILRTVRWPFHTCAVNVDESCVIGEDAVSYVERLAREKAEAATPRRFSELVLGADTVVVVENEIFGKPLDNNDARRMLRDLSGRWHEVLTGVALVDGRTSRSIVAHETTQVKFAVMSEDEINWYISTGEPMDKAGAYAIQGRGARFIEQIKGDYFNVVGLPVRLLYQLVHKF